MAKQNFGVAQKMWGQVTKLFLGGMGKCIFGWVVNICGAYDGKNKFLEGGVAKNIVGVVTIKRGRGWHNLFTDNRK